MLLVLAVCGIPFAIGQRTTTKRSAVADPVLLVSGPVTTLSIGDDSAGGTWTATGNLNAARAFHTATLLPNGLVLVSGGHDGPSFTPSDVLSSAELYDPASGSWTVTGSLNTARYLHTATVLFNGMVLVAGGFSSVNNVSASAELYNPASGTWTVTGNLNTGHDDHTATLLSDGMVLVAGGFDSSFIASASAELYTPAATPTPTPTPCTGRCGPTPRQRPTPHPRP